MNILRTVRIFVINIIVPIMSGVVYAGDSSLENYEKGVDYAIQGNLVNAKGEFEKALNKSPYSGSIEISLNAIKEVSKKKLQTESAVYFFRGGSFANKGNIEQAMNNYNKALEIEPNFASVYISRGLAYKNEKNYDLAIKDYNKAIEIDPEFATAYSNRGAVYRIKNQYDLAISDYNKAIEVDPKYAGAYYNLGVIYHRYKTQYDLAIKFYSKAIEINPMFADAYYNRGHVYISKLRDKVKGCSDFSKACELGQCKNYRTAKKLGYCS